MQIGGKVFPEAGMPRRNKNKRHNITTCIIPFQQSQRGDEGIDTFVSKFIPATFKQQDTIIRKPLPFQCRGHIQQLFAADIAFFLKKKIIRNHRCVKTIYGNYIRGFIQKHRALLGGNLTHGGKTICKTRSATFKGMLRQHIEPACFLPWIKAL